MKTIKPSELKTILHSKRANIYYLEHCRILVNGGRVEYVTEQAKESLYWNIPIANTTTILLGSGTSITQAAVRELSKAGVLIGFCGGGGTPLFSTTEREFDIQWFTPQSEYRPTEYMHAWLLMWLSDEGRLEAAKHLQYNRLNFIKRCWLEKSRFFDDIFSSIKQSVLSLLDQYKADIEDARTTMAIFSIEARFTKQLYKIVCNLVKYDSFTRVKQGQGSDLANRFLDQGNYLAYGLGATATWVLGLPHSLSVLHGKTRRGGLVFDAADLIKDALVLPQAFISATQGHEEREFRGLCIRNFLQAEALDYIIETLKDVAATQRTDS